jgi:adenine-specific DNA-methyltransferase
MKNAATQSLHARLESLGAPELRRLLVEHLTRRKLGLYWESDAIERDAALNADIVLPVYRSELSHRAADMPAGSLHRNLLIEGDNFDALRLLKSTHAGRIRVIYIDPPYNTGNQDWVYNDRYVGANDRWRHSQWLEFLYRRLTLARDLLAPDGVLLVSINDENRAKLELLLDEVMPGRRVGSFAWRTRQGSMDAKKGFSADHEHVLAYAKESFEFAGSARDETKYSNADNDPRGPWGSQMLIKSHNARDRPEAYYPIHNIETDTWYLCDPDSVWRFSSLTRPLKKKKLQVAPIETLIAEARVLWPENEKTVVYETKDALLAAIAKGEAPKEFRIYAQIPSLEKLAPKNAKVQRLLTYLEPIENWVGRRLGFGRPRYKRFLENLKRDSNPLSSWIQPAADKESGDEFFDDMQVMTSGGTSEGTALLRQISGTKDFQYPKPLSLIKGLLQQSTAPGDIVLDFFAGSGTTGHAVMELNAEDGGERRYILCSSTEATVKEPDKNLCRDVCAERLRRVAAGYGSKRGFSAAQGGEFAYLQLDRIAPADLPFESTSEQARLMLELRLTQGVSPAGEENVQLIARAGDCDIVLCTGVDAASIDRLAAWHEQRPGRLAIYTHRPESLRETLAARGVEATCYGLLDVLRQGQAGAWA